MCIPNNSLVFLEVGGNMVRRSEALYQYLCYIRDTKIDEYGKRIKRFVRKIGKRSSNTK